jgi:hypothetical protein
MIKNGGREFSLEQIQRVLNALPPDETMSLQLWLSAGSKSLWDWACAQQNRLNPRPGSSWLFFVDGEPVSRVCRHLGVWATQFRHAWITAHDLEIVCQLHGLSQQRDYWHLTLMEFAAQSPYEIPELIGSQVPRLVDFECVHMLIEMIELAANQATLRQWMKSDQSSGHTTPKRTERRVRGR